MEDALPHPRRCSGQSERDLPHDEAPVRGTAAVLNRDRQHAAQLFPSATCGGQPSTRAVGQHPDRDSVPCQVLERARRFLQGGRLLPRHRQRLPHLLRVQRPLLRVCACGLGSQTQGVSAVAIRLANPRSGRRCFACPQGTAFNSSGWCDTAEKVQCVGSGVAVAPGVAATSQPAAPTPGSAIGLVPSTIPLTSPGSGPSQVNYLIRLCKQRQIDGLSLNS